MLLSEENQYKITTFIQIFPSFSHKTNLQSSLELDIVCATLGEILTNDERVFKSLTVASSETV